MLSKIKNFLSIISGKEESLTKQALTNSAYSFFTSIISKVGGLVFAILIARALLPELFGLYSLALSIILTAGTFADLGVNTALIRYLAESASKGKRGEIEYRSRLRFFLNIKLTLASTSGVILFFISPLIAYLYNKPELTLPLQIGSLYIFVVAIQTFLSSFFVSMKKLRYPLISEIIFQITRLVLFMTILYAYISVTSVIGILVLSFSFSAIFYLLIFFYRNKNLIFGKTANISKKKMIYFISWTTLNSVLVSIYFSINTFMLGFFVENNFLGYYNVILSIVVPVASIINLSAVFLPIFTEIKGKRLKRGFEKTGKYSVSLAIPAAFGLSFIIGSIIRVIYGYSYFPQEYYLPLLIASIFSCFLIPLEVINSVYIILFTSKEKIKLINLVMFLAVVFNVLLNYILIKEFVVYGPIWAVSAISISTFITRFLVSVVYALISKRRMDLIINIKDIVLPVIPSLIMLAFLFGFDRIVKPDILGTVFMVFLAIIVYTYSFLATKKIFDCKL